MYPETDVPPIRITKERWQATVANLPPTPEEKVQALVSAHALSPELGRQLVADGLDTDFQALVAAGADGAMAARILLQFLPDLKNADKALGILPDLLRRLKSGAFAKEALPGILQAFDSGGVSLDQAIAKAGAGFADASAVDAVVKKVVAERLDFVKSRGLAAQGPLMGPVMAELRGKVDGAVIAQKLKAAIEAAMQA